ncbi:MAG TPA: radical SAM protein, partial [Thermodesulfovibrionales bacterium]|nr:radical SAM protein [Thermodesulfovibrionales bacterium]
NAYVPVPADRARDDLQKIAGRVRPDLIHLLDNAVSVQLMTDLAERPLGVPWHGFARIDRSIADREFCAALKWSGCVTLNLGLESGDQEVLDRLEKGIRLETASLALKSLKEAGIAVYVYLMFGTPSETPGAARRTLEFIARHHEEIGFLNLALFNMPITGPEAGELGTSRFYEGDLSLYTDFSHPEGWDRKQVRSFLENEFKRHRAVSAILRRDPPVFTSSHAPFFVMT